MPATVDLRSLVRRPFELLQELERRGRAAVAGQGREAGTEAEWVGIAFRLGDEQFVAARDEVREVLTYPATLTRVPGAKAWVSGLANVRGHLLPIIDLKALLGGGLTKPGHGSRVLTVNHREVPAGLVVDDVMGFRRFAESERSKQSAQPVVRCERYLAGVFSQGQELWPIFDFRRLVESTQFLQAAE